MKASDIVPPAGDELVVVVGPTASGKSALAMELAERWGGEIVSADSVQVYRRFDVGSAKPTEADRARVVHHLVDVADPLDAMDAGSFATRAGEAILDVRARGRVPIVCGGTFLWVKALVWGLAEVLPHDDATRARHREIAAAEGRPALHARLARVDAAAAARLSPNDLVRVSRALEVFELTSKPISTWHGEHGFRGTRRQARLLGVARERAELDRRIVARTDACLKLGWIDEVRGILADGYEGARALGSVGYREVWSFVQGALREDALAPAIVRRTRVLARRQRTWLRDLDVAWVDP